jgi:hypothetical protein
MQYLGTWFVLRSLRHFRNASPLRAMRAEKHMHAFQKATTLDDAVNAY